MLLLLLVRCSSLRLPINRRVFAASVASVPATAFARGRGTQPAMMQRYSPRIIAYGTYLTSDLPKIVDAADWPALKKSVAAEVAKKKGNIGPLYSGESAMSLWANTYSETVVTPKQKDMDEQVAVLADVRARLETIALKGTGEGLKKTGGFFGIGAKTELPPAEVTLKKEANKAIADAKAAYNAYIAINNNGVPLEINPLPAI